MTKPLSGDNLWILIEPILPLPSIGGTGIREALTGILFVLKTGMPWEICPGK